MMNLRRFSGAVTFIFDVQPPAALAALPDPYDPQARKNNPVLAAFIEISVPGICRFIMTGSTCIGGRRPLCSWPLSRSFMRGLSEEPGPGSH